MSVMKPEFKVRRRDKRIWFVGLAIFAGVFLFTFLAGRFRAVDSDAGAASLAEFDPGYIISDWQMGNYASMTEAEIQAFLTAKNSCWQTSYDYYLELTAASPGVKWHYEDGHFVCLSEELFGDGEVIGKGETAAHVIWQAAQDYRINPQVLLVLLQKETGLITDPIPNNYDYRKATGYGCPDTAPCSAEYYGLKNQIRHAAALFRTVLDGGWTNYPLGVNYVQYNPSWECGGSEVNIRSLATSALYRYTPYQPNAGALAAGYGTAYCGAYGNRNFYLYFQDWFGGITEEGEWLSLDTPRYMISKKNIAYFSVGGNVYLNEKLAESTMHYYTSKVFLNDGSMCLRTEEDERANRNVCVMYDDLNEVVWNWVKLDTMRYLKLTEESKAIDPTTLTVIDDDLESVMYFKEKLFLPNGKMCLRNEIDRNTCIDFDTLEEVDIEEIDMLEPRYLTAKSGTVTLFDPVTMAEKGKILNGEKVFFSKKILTFEGELCLVSEKGGCAKYNELDETWVDMERPRNMMMNKQSFKIDVTDLSNDYRIVLPVGMVRKFTKKRFLSDNTWCLQTEYDDQNETSYCIRYSELSEL